MLRDSRENVDREPSRVRNATLRESRSSFATNYMIPPSAAASRLSMTAPGASGDETGDGAVVENLLIRPQRLHTPFATIVPFAIKKGRLLTRADHPQPLRHTCRQDPTLTP